MSTEQPAAPAAQDSTVSIEDRIGAVFGDAEEPNEPVQAPATDDPAQEAASEEEAPQTPETFEFEIDGEKYVLPKKLEKSFMHQRDYTQGKQNLSLKEKQADFVLEQARIANFRQEFEKSAASELQQLAAYDSVLAQPVDWSALTTDQKLEQMGREAQWRKEREALAKSLSEKHQQWAQKTEAALKDLQSKADETVRQRVPNWNADTWKAISEHAKADGYSEVELNSINDPRHKLTLWKAQQFDAIKAKASKTVVDAKTVKTTPSNPMPQAVKDKLQFRKEVAKHKPGSLGQQKAVEAQIAKIFG